MKNCYTIDESHKSFLINAPNDHTGKKCRQSSDVYVVTFSVKPLIL